MKTTITTIALSAIVACLAFSAQAQDEIFENSLPPVLRAADDRGNKDGKIQREELPERLQRVIEKYDLNGDGVITPLEVDDGKAKAFAEQPKLEKPKP